MFYSCFMTVGGEGERQQEPQAGDLYGREEVIVRGPDGTPRMRRWTDLHVALPPQSTKKPDQGQKRGR